MMIEASEIIESAHFYREQGLYVLPLKSDSKIPARSLRQIYAQPADNLTEWFSHGENVGGAFGNVSENLCALDIDMPREFERFKRRLSDSQRRRVTDLEADSWVMNTATPGRRQILFRSFAPLKQKAERKEYGFGVRGEQNGLPPYSVLPPSAFVDKHGQRSLYSWQISPQSRSLPVLNESDVKEFSEFMPFEIATTAFHKYGLSEKLWRVLKYGSIEDYTSRSEAEQAVIFRLVKIGWSFQKVYDLFECEASCGSKYRSKKNKRAWLQISYDNATAHANAMSYVDRQIDQLTYEMQFFSFGSRTYFTDRAVYSTILEIARKAGTLKPDLAVRRIAEAAAIHRFTAALTLQRLYAIGLIDLDGKSKHRTNRYAITVAENLPELEAVSHLDISHCKAKECEDMSFSDTETMMHDVFRHRGLGKSGGVIYAYLNRKPGQSGDEISSATGIARMTVFRKLARMKVSGLAVPTEGKWNLIAGHDLDRAAAQLGTKGAGDRQREEHEKQRAAHAESLFQWEERRYR